MQIELNNFRVATLTELQSIRGGNGGDDIETGPLECVDKSSRFVLKGSGGSNSISL